MRDCRKITALPKSQAQTGSAKIAAKLPELNKNSLECHKCGGSRDGGSSKSEDI